MDSPICGNRGNPRPSEDVQYRRNRSTDPIGTRVRQSSEYALTGCETTPRRYSVSLRSILSVGIQRDVYFFVGIEISAGVKTAAIPSALAMANIV